MNVQEHLSHGAELSYETSEEPGYYYEVVRCARCSVMVRFHVAGAMPAAPAPAAAAAPPEGG